MITRHTLGINAKISANEGHTEFSDEDYRADYGTCGVLHIGGLSAPPESALTRVDSYGDITQRLVAQRPLVAFAPLSGAAWGNDASKPLVALARLRLENTLKTRPRKTILYAVSGGAPTALNALLDDPTAYCAVWLTIPALDLVSMRANGFSASIDAAWGRVPTAADDPAQKTAAIAAANVPIRIDYGGADPTVLPAPVVAFANAVNAINPGLVTLVNMGATVAHDQTKVDIDAALAWLNSKAADDSTIGPNATGSVIFDGPFTTDGTNPDGTLLQAYVPATGASPIKHPLATFDAEIRNSRVRTLDTANNSGQDSLYTLGAPATADYDVIVGVKNLSELVGSVQLWARLDAAAITGYALVVNQTGGANSGLVALYRFAAGAVVETLWSGIRWINGDGEFRLQVRNGLQRAFWTPATGPIAGKRQQIGPTTFSTGLATANKPGLQLRNIAGQTTGLHVDYAKCVNA